MFSELKVELDVPLELSDGTILRSTIFSPVTAETLPVIVLRLPYDKNLYYSLGMVRPQDFARHGFIVVVQDVRGRFSSGGHFVATTNEGRDGFETVEWAAKLSGSNGRVGMYGDSYLAECQWSAALNKPPSLKTIIPGVSPSWSNHDGFISRGGVHEIGCRLNWVFGAISADFVERNAAKGNPIRALEIMAEEARPFADGSVFSYRTLEPFASSQSFLSVGMESVAWPLEDARHLENRTMGRHSEIELPVFMTGGWFDVFLGSTLLQYRAAFESARKAGTKAPQLVIGPWTHLAFGNSSGELHFGPFGGAASVCERKSLFEMYLDWFKVELAHESATEIDAFPVKLFLSGLNEWREFTEFPFGFDSAKTLYLASNQALSESAPQEIASENFTFDPSDPVPTIGGPTLIGSGSAGPLDQTPLYGRPDILRFLTPKLAEDLTCIGQVGAILYVSSDAEDTDFVVRICDVTPEGKSLVIADGIIRCKYRKSFDLDGWVGSFEELPPMSGEIAELEISLWSIGHTFLKGHRVGVDITSSSSPRWQVNANTGKNAWEDSELRTAKQTIHFGKDTPSRILLPSDGKARSQEWQTYF